MTYAYVVDPTTGQASTSVIQLTNPDGSISYIPNSSDNREWVVYQAWLADGNTIVTDTSEDALTLAKAAKIASLSAQCGTEAVSGFYSTALGSYYFYPSKLTDQQNLTASVVDAGIKLTAAAWSASTYYKSGSLITNNGEAYLCVITGNTDATPPDFPTVLDATVTDGTVVWQLWSTWFWCQNIQGSWGLVEHSATQMQQVGVDGKAFISRCIKANADLAAEVEACTTVEQVQAIEWDASSS